MNCAGSDISVFVCVSECFLCGWLNNDVAMNLFTRNVEVGSGICLLLYWNEPFMLNSLDLIK